MSRDELAWKPDSVLDDEGRRVAFRKAVIVLVVVAVLLVVVFYVEGSMEGQASGPVHTAPSCTEKDPCCGPGCGSGSGPHASGGGPLAARQVHLLGAT